MAEAMDTFWRELVAEGSLMAAVAAFNRDGHRPILGLDDLPAKAGGGESEPPKGRLASFLERALGDRPGLRHLFPGRGQLEEFWDFGPAPRRLLLLGPEEFHALALRFGAAIWGERLAMTINGPAVRTLNAELGPELLDWAVGRGRFWLGSLGEAYRQGFEGPLDRAGLSLTGKRAINLAWWPLPPELVARAGSRLLHAEDPFLARLAAPAVGQDTLAAWTFNRLKTILLTEVAPSWRACFS